MDTLPAWKRDGMKTLMQLLLEHSWLSEQMRDIGHRAADPL